MTGEEFGQFWTRCIPPSWEYSDEEIALIRRRSDVADYTRAVGIFREIMATRQDAFRIVPASLVSLLRAASPQPEVPSGEPSPKNLWEVTMRFCKRLSGASGADEKTRAYKQLFADYDSAGLKMDAETSRKLILQMSEVTDEPGITA